MSYLKKGMRSLVALFVLGALGNILGYFTRVLLTRTITPMEYGLFYAVLSLVMFIMMFANLGFGNSLVKYVSEFRSNKKYKKMKFTLLFTIGIRLVLVLIISFLLFILAKPLANNYFKTNDAILVLVVFSISIIFMTLDQILSRVFNSLHQNLFMGLVDFSQKSFFLSFLVIFLLMSYQNTVFSVSLLFLCSFLITFIIFIGPAVKKTRFLHYKSAYSKKLIKTLSSFAFSSFLVGISYMIIGYIDTIMLTYFSSLEQVGIYNVVLPTVMVLAFFSTSIHHVFFPMVSDLWSRKKKDKVREGFVIIQKYSLVMIIPIVLVLVVFPKLIINLLFGADYVSGSLAMIILAIGMIFFTKGLINQATLNGIGRPQEITKVLLFASLFNFITNLVLIPLFGIIGAALTTTLSYFLIMVLLSGKLKKLVAIHPNYGLWFKLIVCSIVFVLVVGLSKNILMLNQYLEAFICLLFAGVSYLIIAIVLKLIDFKEIRFFVKSFFKN